jgi:transposase
MRRKKHYPEDFKRETVKLLLTSGKTQKTLCDELGIPYGIIGRWKKELDLENPINKDIKDARDKRILELEKEVQHLKQQRDILKKAMGITLNL